MRRSGRTNRARSRTGSDDPATRPAQRSGVVVCRSRCGHLGGQEPGGVKHRDLVCGHVVAPRVPRQLVSTPLAGALVGDDPATARFGILTNDHVPVLPEQLDGCGLDTLHAQQMCGKAGRCTELSGAGVQCLAFVLLVLCLSGLTGFHVGERLTA